MKKILFSIIAMMIVVSCAGSAQAITFDQGYEYKFKFTNWEVATGLTALTDAAGNPVPSGITGYYKVTTISRSPAEIIGGSLFVNVAEQATWYTTGQGGEFLDGTFSLTHIGGVDGGTQSYSASLDLWSDSIDASPLTLATAAATFGGGDGDSLIATLVSNFYNVDVDGGSYDGLGGNDDYTVSGGLAFVTDNTGLDWLDIAGPISGFYQLGFTASLFISGSPVWDIVSDDPLVGTAPVPEPASMLLVGMGLVGGFLRKKKLA